MGRKSFSFEFLIPNSKNIKAVIECKQVWTKIKRNHRITCYKLAYETGYKSHLIHKNFPKTKVIVIINHDRGNLPTRVQKILENETDLLLINSSESELQSALKNSV